MPRLTVKVPKYRLHKPSGQAVVTLNHRDTYLGHFGSPESKDNYNRVVGLWQANKREGASALPRASSISINELFLRYWTHAEGYYIKAGRPTSQLGLIRLALRSLLALYGDEPATAFGPLAFKNVQQAMIQRGSARGVVNKYAGIIKRMFKWGVENELTPPSVYHGLQAVNGLRRGRSEARETDPIKPVPVAYIAATLPFASNEVQTMIQLQLLTAMRPGEVTIMRGSDLETTGKLWVYTPSFHKTEHHGRQRLIYLGPQAQHLIRPFLKTDLSAYLFSPKEAQESRNEGRKNRRRSPMTPSQTRRKRKTNPVRAPRSHYDDGSYRRAIQYACDQAFPLPGHLAVRKGESVEQWTQRLTPEGGVQVKAWRKTYRWSPNQLRHNAATLLRKQYGLDAARAILGHSSPAVTEIYAELDQAKAMQIMADIG